MNRYLSKTKTKTLKAQNTRKKCLVSIASRAMQINTTIRQGTSVTVAITKKDKLNRSLQGCKKKKKREFLYTLEMQVSITIWRTVWRCLKKLQIYLPCDLGTYRKEIKSAYMKTSKHCNVHSSQARHRINLTAIHWWMNKKHTVFNQKKNEIPLFAAKIYGTGSHWHKAGTQIWQCFLSKVKVKS